MSERLGLFLLIALASGLPMGLLGWWLSGSFLVGTVLGAMSGTGLSIFLFLFTIVVKKFRVFGLKAIEGWAPDEVVIRSGDAKIFRNGLAEGGQLFLTNRRLRFVGHRLGAQILDSSYAACEIAAAEPTRTLGLVPNGLRVSLQDGRVLNFVVYDRKGWANELNQFARRTGA